MATEKRLIPIQDAIKLPRGACAARYPTTFAIELSAIADKIAKLPTVGAVEILDCKKCTFNDGIAYWHQCEDALEIREITSSQHGGKER